MVIEGVWGRMGEILRTLPSAFDAVVYPDRLAVPEFVTFFLAEALVGVVLEMRHGGFTAYGMNLTAKFIVFVFSPLLF